MEFLPSVDYNLIKNKILFNDKIITKKSDFKNDFKPINLLSDNLIEL
jgi:hypothetical protein